MAGPDDEVVEHTIVISQVGAIVSECSFLRVVVGISFELCGDFWSCWTTFENEILQWVGRAECETRVWDVRKIISG